LVGSSSALSRGVGHIALFSSLDVAAVQLLTQRARLRVAATNEVIFEQGDSGRQMFVVLAGSAMLVKRVSEDHNVEVVRANIGDWFGEMSLLDVLQRPVTATALEPTQLLVVCPTDLDALYRQDVKMYSLLVMNIARQLSRKLRVQEDRLAQAISAR
jgi:CRP-like cAMP-binding protein